MSEGLEEKKKEGRHIVIILYSQCKIKIKSKATEKFATLSSFHGLFLCGT